MKKLQEYSTLNRKIFPNLVVLGMTASGKTTVAYQLARLIGFGVLDLDLLIERQQGMSIEQIFLEKGEDEFREIEARALNSVEGILNHIIIPGAGAVERDDSFEVMRRLGPTLWLATPLSEIVHRLMRNPDELLRRPLLAQAVSIEDLGQRQQYIREKLEEIELRRIKKYQLSDYAMTISFATAGTCAQLIKNILLSHDDSDILDTE